MPWPTYVDPHIDPKTKQYHSDKQYSEMGEELPYLNANPPRTGNLTLPPQGGYPDAPPIPDESSGGFSSDSLGQALSGLKGVGQGAVAAVRKLPAFPSPVPQGGAGFSMPKWGDQGAEFPEFDPNRGDPVGGNSAPASPVQSALGGLWDAALAQNRKYAIPGSPGSRWGAAPEGGPLSTHAGTLQAAAPGPMRQWSGEGVGPSSNINSLTAPRDAAEQPGFGSSSLEDSPAFEDIDKPGDKWMTTYGDPSGPLTKSFAGPSGNPGGTLNNRSAAAMEGLQSRSFGATHSGDELSLQELMHRAAQPDEAYDTNHNLVYARSAGAADFWKSQVAQRLQERAQTTKLRDAETARGEQTADDIQHLGKAPQMLLDKQAGRLTAGSRINAASDQAVANTAAGAVTEKAKQDRAATLQKAGIDNQEKAAQAIAALQKEAQQDPNYSKTLRYHQVLRGLHEFMHLPDPFPKDPTNDADFVEEK